MSASVQVKDPLELSDPATLGTGMPVSGKQTPRDSSDTSSRSTHSRRTSVANALTLTASPAPPSQPSPMSSEAIPNGKPTSSNSMLNGSATAPQTVSSKDPKAAAQAASDMRNIVRRKLTGYVGFANLPNQWHRKSVRKGFNFNVMVVGEYTSNLLGCEVAG
jgi:septin 7